LVQVPIDSIEQKRGALSTMSRTGKLFGLITFCVVTAFAAEAPAGFSNTRAEGAVSPEVLTNEGIVALADAGFSDAFIVEKILISNRTRFNTSAEGLAYLRRNGIPQGLVQFVVEHSAQPLVLPGPAAPVAVPVPVQPLAPVQPVQVIAKPVPMPVQPVVAAAPVPAVASVPVIAPAPVVAPVVPTTFVQPAAVIPTAVAAPVVMHSGYVSTWQAVTPVYSNSPAYSYVPSAYGYGYYGYPASYSTPVVTAMPQVVVPVAVVAHHWWQ
jgi:hypothetical protein